MFCGVAPLKPHGVDCNVKEDREARSEAAANSHRPSTQSSRLRASPERERLPRQDPTAVSAARGPPHHASISASYHILRAPARGPDRDAQERGEAKHRWRCPGVSHQADQCGEHHERHTRASSTQCSRRPMLTDGKALQLGILITAVMSVMRYLYGTFRGVMYFLFSFSA